jgi:histidinol-phosphate aminotransferase
VSASRRPQPRPEIMAVASYVGGESHLPGMSRIIKLSSNEGAFGTSPAARAAIARSADSMSRYPDGSARAMREAIGVYYGLDPARIVCGNGSDEILNLLIQAYGGPGTELLMSAHGFSLYGIFATLAGGAVIKLPERDLVADVDAFLAAVTKRTRLVFLANPNNPTGSLVPLPELRRLRDGLPPDVLLVLDGAYAEYVERPDFDAGLSLVEAGENAVMTRTFSKIWGLGGARLGWGYGPAAIIDVLNRLRPPFNIGNAAVAAGIAALAEPGWEQRSRSHNHAARARVTAALQAIGLRVWPSEANFVLADFDTVERARAADAFLRARGIIVRNVASYGLPHCLRITIGTDEECAAVIDALRDFATRNVPWTAAECT